MEAIESFQGEFRFLSNFFPLTVPVMYEDLNFFTTETAYVAAKTIDHTTRVLIQAMTPGKAKKFGSEIVEKNLSPNPLWSDSFRLELMKGLVWQKFNKNADLKTLLLGTKDAYIIEGNTWHDNFFGVCTCGNCPIQKQRLENEGNNLGKILMDVRTRLYGEA